MTLRTSDVDEFDYFSDGVREENRRAFEELEQKTLLDKKDLKSAYHLVAQEANFKFPLSSQAEAMKKLQKGKNEDLTLCSQNLEFRKYKAKIIDAFSKISFPACIIKISPNKP